MSATAQHLLGQLADGRFPLRKLLGVSQNSAVFLTSEPVQPGDPAPDIAIKLIPEDPATSDLQFNHWRAAAALSHPGLLRIHHFGRCTIDGSPCLYVVTELADEDLGQLLPRRALTPDETRGMLAAVLPALDFLHENGLVHAGLKPSNIHAIGDNVKLSADRMLPAGESSSAWPFAAPFRAPESILFPASDIWSLGMALSETLTKNFPAREASGQFALPELPAPFAEIVRSALVEDATLRITLDEVRSLLDPTFVAKRKVMPSATPVARQAGPRTDDFTNETANTDSQIAAGNSPYVRPPSSPDSPESLLAAVEAAPVATAASSPRRVQPQPLQEIDPLAVPLSPVSPPARPTSAPQAARVRIPVSSLPQVNATIGGPRRVSNPPATYRSNKLFLVSVAAAIVLLGLFVPRYFLRSRSSARQDSGSVRSTPAPDPAVRANPSPSTVPSPTRNSSLTSTPSADSAALHAPRAKSPSDAPSPSDGNPRTRTTNSSSGSGATRPSGAGNSAPPDASRLPVLRKVLPEVSERSRSTIRGTVRINVRVQLTADGAVSSAELASPASSQFFADLALKAARQWQFAKPSSSTPSEASSAVIRFDFTPTATSAYLP